MQGEQRAVRARVSGMVQGVSYRVWTRNEAVRLGLTGWVRNERDGSVAALIVGADAAVAAMIDRLWQGPRGALVSKVDVEEASDNVPADFRIIV
ncbi:acylphosphatase [Mesorhizobium sp. M1C.F.Ca.ET.193.01.1.1]|uniref:acylphosphatase n=1 Tax=unclassified Mesorhizobium TaxID=325217 RepID=UPI000FD46914|nr:MULTISPECIES: acylphosphatase [unclassified Mesorhizobium]TGS96442.1 acylphosphatase [bacterium M00.F.Ca.ET.177.01.1.1]TGQ52172.1 acylphosphatase [Mesorhizobium sp. M1C.F.Ca.ET.210.01.1.1]TGQ68811.1 acylphosphatase [Mesorhizobium sp. M1C.F.Ca.ET.212.01.1.1]TGR04162.1 acylphosphatase [Mesorhizobium sp. M1C.F.Ca.ET.204.01.1.1]TGR24827.1 acylphosphatase [Mesorhizobium sp. M1C.F.Ca.ET.196.01.1.1]